MKTITNIGFILIGLGLCLQATSAQQPDEQEKVAPGLITWHGSLAEACKTARESQKPVLLFQMVGRLDDRFT